MVTHILQFLNVSDRKDASLVNHTWYEASRDPSLLQDVVFLIPKNGTPNVPAATHRKNRHLVLENIDARSDIVRNCEAMCEGLESLSVRGTDISEGMLVLLLSHCRVLQSLDLSCCNSLFMTGMLLSKQEDVDRIRSTMGSLKVLNLSSIRYLSDATFNRVVAIAPNLENLSLAGCQIVFHTSVYSSESSASACNNTAVLTFKNIAHFISVKARKLKILDFGHTRINDSALEFLAETPELWLRELYVDSCREITDEGIAKLSRKQTELTHLDISQCVDLSDSAVYAIAAHLPKLKMLSISKCRQITDGAVYQLRTMRHLRELNLSSCYSLSSPGLVKGLCSPSHLISLTHLNLNCCNGVQDGFVKELCLAVPGLLHLDLGSCYALHDTSVHFISQHLVHLRFLRLSWCKEISDYALLGVLNPDGSATTGDGPPPMRRNPSKIFGDLASLLPDRPPTELSEKAVESLKSNHANQTGSIYPISNLRYLKTLDLSSLPQLTDASIKDAVKFTELQEFNVGMCQGITDSALFAIGNNLPSVEVLNLSQCRKITDDGLIFLIVRLHRLRSLNISSCDSITDASIEALRAHSPHLKHLDVSMCGNISPQCVDQVEHSMRHLTCVKKRLVGGTGYGAV